MYVMAPKTFYWGYDYLLIIVIINLQNDFLNKATKSLVMVCNECY